MVLGSLWPRAGSAASHRVPARRRDGPGWSRLRGSGHFPAPSREALSSPGAGPTAGGRRLLTQRVPQGAPTCWTGDMADLCSVPNEAEMARCFRHAQFLGDSQNDAHDNTKEQTTEGSERSGWRSRQSSRQASCGPQCPSVHRPSCTTWAWGKWPGSCADGDEPQVTKELHHPGADTKATHALSEQTETNGVSLPQMRPTRGPRRPEQKRCKASATPLSCKESTPRRP